MANPNLPNINPGQLRKAARAMWPALFKDPNTDFDHARENAMRFLAIGLIAIGFGVDGYADAPEQVADATGFKAG
jgi:hypothetical protein